MGMVFCRGCGKKINDSALACPHCGATQTLTSYNTNNEGADFFELAFQPLKKYASFDGRARRKEYWYFAVVYLIGYLLAAIGGEALVGLFSLTFLIPSIAVGIRRMHDTNRSGWWLIVPIANLVFACSDSQPGSNRFGDNPKGVQPK